MKNFLNKISFGKKKKEQEEDSQFHDDETQPKQSKKKSFISQDKSTKESAGEVDKTVFQPLQSKSLLSDDDIKAKTGQGEAGKPHPKKSTEKKSFFSSISSKFKKDKAKPIPGSEAGEGDAEFFPDVENDSNSKIKAQISPVRGLMFVVILGGGGYVLYDLFIAGTTEDLPPPPVAKKNPIKKKKIKNNKPKKIFTKKTEEGSSPKNSKVEQNNAKLDEKAIQNRVKDQMKEVGAAKKEDFLEKDMIAKNKKSKDEFNKLEEKMNLQDSNNNINKKNDKNIKLTDLKEVESEKKDLKKLAENIESLESDLNKEKEIDMNKDFSELEGEGEEGESENEGMENIKLSEASEETVEEEKFKNIKPVEDILDPASKINVVLDSLNKKYEKKLSSKKELSYENPPEYGYRGKGLVYNCLGKHWACIDASSFVVCENNYFSNKYKKSNTECFPYSVYNEMADCSKIQQFFINTVKNTEFCYK